MGVREAGIRLLLRVYGWQRDHRDRWSHWRAGRGHSWEAAWRITQIDPFPTTRRR